jgi:hypothetical protein
MVNPQRYRQLPAYLMARGKVAGPCPHSVLCVTPRQRVLFVGRRCDGVVGAARSMRRGSPTAADGRKVELVTGIEGASSRPVRLIVLRRAQTGHTPHT